MTRYRFQADERLKRSQTIDTLFRKGKAFSVFPLRVVYLSVPLPEGERTRLKVGFSIARKRIRSAVKRNQVRRRLREAWRLQKPRLIERLPQDRQLWVFLIYLDQALPETKSIHSTVAQVLDRLEERWQIGGTSNRERE